MNIENRQRFGVGRTAVYGALKRLEDAGLVRIVDRKSRRLARVEIMKSRRNIEQEEPVAKSPDRSQTNNSGGSSTSTRGIVSALRLPH